MSVQKLTFEEELGALLVNHCEEGSYKGTLIFEGKEKTFIVEMDEMFIKEKAQTYRLNKGGEGLITFITEAFNFSEY